MNNQNKKLTQNKDVLAFLNRILTTPIADVGRTEESDHDELGRWAKKDGATSISQQEFDDLTYDGLIGHYNNNGGNYQIADLAEISKLNPKALKEALKGFESGREEYQEYLNFIGNPKCNIEVRSGVTYSMKCGRDHLVYSKSHFEQNDESIAKWEDDNIGVSMKPENVGNHEFAHFLTFNLYKDDISQKWQEVSKKHPSWSLSQRETFAENEVFGDIVEEAMDEYLKTHKDEYEKRKTKVEEKLMSDSFLSPKKIANMLKDKNFIKTFTQRKVGQISKYATKKPAETIAEAFCDIYTNKDNAQELSKIIKSIITKQCNEAMEKKE